MSGMKILCVEDQPECMAMLTAASKELVTK